MKLIFNDYKNQLNEPIVHFDGKIHQFEFVLQQSGENKYREQGFGNTLAAKACLFFVSRLSELIFSDKTITIQSITI